MDLIGANAKIVSSRNKSVGSGGKIVDETRNTVRIETKTGLKTLIKSQYTFEFDGRIVQGEEIVGRPEERIKRWIRKKCQ